MFFRFVGSRTKVVDLSGLYKDQSVFLLGGAPALKDAAPLFVGKPVILAAMNDAATIVRPQLWFGADEASNYSPSVLKDPGILKFGRLNRANTPLLDSKELMREMPNMLFFDLDEKKKIEEFFDPSVKLGWWKNIFVVALEALYKLGFTKVYTVGCGFKISADKQYAYDKQLAPSQLKYNQNTYSMAVRQTQQLLTVGLHCRANFKIVSCTPDSELNNLAIDSIGLEKAIALESKRVPPHETRRVHHPLKLEKTMFRNEKMLTPIGHHYTMGLSHRKLILSALPKNGRMLEWGSGASTIWFRANMEFGQQLISIEHDPRYAGMTGAYLVPFRPGKGATPEAEELLPGWDLYVNKPDELAPPFDVILVDGVVRNACLEAALRFIKPSGVVFLHDADRDWYVKGKALYPIKEELGASDYRTATLWKGRLA